MTPAQHSSGADGVPEVTIVMPCLNEADTLATCIDKAQRAMREAGIDGEVVVADNGSTDGSQEIAERARRRVVAGRRERLRQRAHGRHRRGARQVRHHGRRRRQLRFSRDPEVRRRSCARATTLVQGCRLPSGGGTVLPGAMPLLHRWLGNPVFSLLVRWWFRAPIHDVYCGMRGFTRERLRRLGLRCTGMEFATEMIIKAQPRSASDIAEVPITLHPDGRKAHAPHLRTFRDGWRTLRFFLLYTPRWLFLTPGLLLIAARAGRLRPRPARRDASAPRPSTSTRCWSPAWRCSPDSRRSRSRSSPRSSRSARGCCRWTRASRGSSRSRRSSAAWCSAR